MFDGTSLIQHFPGTKTDPPGKSKEQKAQERPQGTKTYRDWKKNVKWWGGYRPLPQILWGVEKARVKKVRTEETREGACPTGCESREGKERRKLGHFRKSKGGQTGKKIKGGKEFTM